MVSNETLHCDTSQMQTCETCLERPVFFSAEAMDQHHSRHCDSESECKNVRKHTRTAKKARKNLMQKLSDLESEFETLKRDGETKKSTYDVVQNEIMRLRKKVREKDSEIITLSVDRSRNAEQTTYWSLNEDNVAGLEADKLSVSTTSSDGKIKGRTNIQKRIAALEAFVDELKCQHRSSNEERLDADLGTKASLSDGSSNQGDAKACCYQSFDNSSTESMHISDNDSDLRASELSPLRLPLGDFRDVQLGNCSRIFGPSKERNNQLLLLQDSSSQTECYKTPGSAMLVMMEEHLARLTREKAEIETRCTELSDSLNNMTDSLTLSELVNRELNHEKETLLQNIRDNEAKIEQLTHRSLVILSCSKSDNAEKLNSSKDTLDIVEINKNNEVALLKRKLECIEEQYSSFKTASCQEVLALKREKKELSDRVSDIKSKLTGSEDNVDSLEKDNAKLAKLLNEIELSKKQTERDWNVKCIDLQARHDSISKRNEESDGKLREMELRIDEQESIVLQQKQHLENAVVERQSKNTELQCLTAELNSSKQKSDLFRRQHSNCIEAESTHKRMIESLRVEIDGLIREKHELSDKFNEELCKERASGENVRQQANSYQTQIAELFNQLNAIRCEQITMREKHEEELHCLQERLKTNMALRKKIPDLRCDERSRRSSSASLEREHFLQATEKSMPENSKPSLENEIKNLKNFNDVQAKEVSKLKIHIQDIERLRSHDSKDMETLRRELREKTNELLLLKTCHPVRREKLAVDSGEIAKIKSLERALFRAEQDNHGCLVEKDIIELKLRGVESELKSVRWQLDQYRTGTNHTKFVSRSLDERARLELIKLGEYGKTSYKCQGVIDFRDVSGNLGGGFTKTRESRSVKKENSIQCVAYLDDSPLKLHSVDTALSTKSMKLDDFSVKAVLRDNTKELPSKGSVQEVTKVELESEPAQNLDLSITTTTMKVAADGQEHISHSKSESSILGISSHNSSTNGCTISEVSMTKEFSREGDLASLDKHETTGDSTDSNVGFENSTGTTNCLGPLEPSAKDFISAAKKASNAVEILSDKLFSDQSTTHIQQQTTLIRNDDPPKSNASFCKAVSNHDLSSNSDQLSVQSAESISLEWFDQPLKSVENSVIPNDDQQTSDTSVCKVSQVKISKQNSRYLSKQINFQSNQPNHFHWIGLTNQ